MSTYSLINNGDTGLSVRTTLNSLLTDINTAGGVGSAGSSGSSGISGSSGSSGSSGVSGAAGSSGSSGSSGQSGSSGSSGSSGVSGDAIYGDLSYRMLAYEDLISYKNGSTASNYAFVEFTSKLKGTAPQRAISSSSNSANFKYQGIVAKNRSIYSLSSGNESVIYKYNPETQVLATFSLSNDAGVNMAYLPNDKIVFRSNTAQVIHVWDTTTDTGVTYSFTSTHSLIVPVSATISYIFGAYGGATNCIKFNPETGVSTTINFGTTYDTTAWVLAKNNKIYSIPNFDTKVRALDISTDTFETISGVTFSGNVYRYGGGLMSLYDGCIYGWGANDQSILKINPDTNTAERIIPNGTWSTWPNSYSVGQDIFGVLYVSNNASGKAFKFDPSNNTLTDTGLSVGSGYNAGAGILYFDSSLWFGTSTGSRTYGFTIPFKANESIILDRLINYNVGRLF